MIVIAVVAFVIRHHSWRQGGLAIRPRVVGLASEAQRGHLVRHCKLPLFFFFSFSLGKSLSVNTHSVNRLELSFSLCLSKIIFSVRFLCS